MAIVKCPNCGNSVSELAESCPKCGAQLHPTAQMQGSSQRVTQQIYNAVPTRPALTPEQEQYLDKFHWGSFYFNWIWALCNELVVYGLIALVISLFTSGIGVLIIAFVFGFKGNRWAWGKSKTATFEEFAKRQEPWDKWGKILFIISIVLFVLYLLIFVFAMAS